MFVLHTLTKFFKKIIFTYSCLGIHCLLNDNDNLKFTIKAAGIRSKKSLSIIYYKLLILLFIHFVNLRFPAKSCSRE